MHLVIHPRPPNETAPPDVVTVDARRARYSHVLDAGRLPYEPNHAALSASDPNDTRRDLPMEAHPR